MSTSQTNNLSKASTLKTSKQTEMAVTTESEGLSSIEGPEMNFLSNIFIIHIAGMLWSV